MSTCTVKQIYCFNHTTLICVNASLELNMCAMWSITKLILSLILAKLPYLNIITSKLTSITIITSSDNWRERSTAMDV